MFTETQAKISTEKKRDDSTMIADARELLRCHPAGMSSKKLSVRLLKTKSMPKQLADTLISQFLGDRPEFIFENNRWKLIDNDPVDLNDVPFVVVDVETTGGFAGINRIIEIAAFRITGSKITAGTTSLVNPKCPIPPFISSLTGIRDEHVAEAPFMEEVLPGFFDFLGDSVFVGHSARFDYRFINEEAKLCGMPLMGNEIVCTVKLARRAFPGERSYGLDRMIERFSIDIDPKERHRGHGDAWATAKLLLLCLDKLRNAGIGTLGDLMVFNSMPPKQTASKYNIIT